jgi:hypothetical protein
MTKYTNINPLQAGLFGSVTEQGGYPWSGHAAVMGRIRNAWQNQHNVPGYFGNRESGIINTLSKTVRGFRNVLHCDNSWRWILCMNS